MNAFERAHIRDIALRNRKIEQAINDAVKDIGRRFTTVKGKRFASIMTGRLKDLHDQILNDGKDGIRNQWMLANKMNNKGLDGYLASVKISDALNQSFRAPNLSALNAFIDRTEKGMNLSDRVWSFTDGVKDSMEGLIKSGVLEGKSAITLSKELKGFINGKPIRYEGRLIPGKNLNFQAIRLAATEMNMAFRTSDYLQNSRLPFTTGVTVHLSAAHPETDICDALQGEYPKGFNFTGWHPLCYSDDTEVYTSEGWKLFKDLSGKEQILSINPDTKNLEWTAIVRQVKYDYNGDMIRFYSHSLDMIVTPDHKMVGYDRHNGKYREMKASEFYDAMAYVPNRNIYGSPVNLYRSSGWIGKNPEGVQIGKHRIPVKIFAEFMAYYLSDGCVSRKYAVVISQWEKASPEQYKTISQCLDSLPFKHSKKHNGFFFYDKDLWEYLSQFGKAHEKYVPLDIKELSPEYLKVFLDAYIICDGHIRSGRKWRGGNFNSERTFMTSSKRIAGDIGELILKIGHHPSFFIGSKKGTVVKHHNGQYVQKHDLIVIRDCRSQYATQFKREKVSYSGFVYDIEVEKNHVIYVRRNGKCLWGSNCICYATYETMPKEEFVKYIKTGEIDQSRFVTDINPAARQYLNENGDRLMGYKNPPYWLKENFTKDIELRKAVHVDGIKKSIKMAI